MKQPKVMVLQYEASPTTRQSLIFAQDVVSLKLVERKIGRDLIDFDFGLIELRQEDRWSLHREAEVHSRAGKSAPPHMMRLEMKNCEHGPNMATYCELHRCVNALALPSGTSSR